MESTCCHFNLILVDVFCVSGFPILICDIPAGVQGGRVVHDQATILELKSMFSEMKELLHQQVTCSVPQSCVSRRDS